MTRVPDNKDCHLLSADTGKQIQTGEYLILPAQWHIYIIEYTFIMQNKMIQW